MSRVKIIYLGIGQRFRQSLVSFNPEWPTFILNRGIHPPQAHHLQGNPIFLKQDPLRLNKWEELVAAQPPQSPVEVGARLMLCEDNAAFPIVCRPWTSSIERDRMRLKSLQEARQRIETLIIKDVAQSNILNLVGLTAICIAAAAGMVAVAIIANKAFG